MTNEPFEPDATRYHHLGCCDAHVATSARVVVAAAIVALLFKAIASANMDEWASVLGEHTLGSFLFELISISLLNIAVFKERGLLIWPYVISQVFVVANIVRSSFIEYQTEYSIYDPYNKRLNATAISIAVAKFVGRVIWIAMSAYFVFIIINFSLFLKNRAKAYTFHAARPIEPATIPTNARQTIFNYQRTLAPRYPRPPPAQHQTQILNQNQSPCNQFPAPGIFEPPPPYQP